MNNQLIMKTIKYNKKSCPDFVYENPLLYRKVARELAESIVKILRVTDQKSNLNTNLRQSILENIRKLCQKHTQDHFKITNVYIEMLYKFYNKQVAEITNTVNSTDHKLDAFLIRKFKDPGFSSRHQTSLNADVIQGLINLNNDGFFLEKLSAEIINWDSNDNKYVNILKTIWQDEDSNTKKDYLDDVAIKMKGEIEKQLLEAIHNLLTKQTDIEKSITCKEMERLVKKCSQSCECFRTCCGVLNSLFIMTNYDEIIESFITRFVRNVKLAAPEHTFSVMYPLHLQCTVLLLDVDKNELAQLSCREQYINNCLHYLSKLNTESKHDFILLLSHFPQWFDLYFHQEKLQ